MKNTPKINETSTKINSKLVLGALLGGLGAILGCLGGILDPRGAKIPKKVEKWRDRSGLWGGLGSHVGRKLGQVDLKTD